MKIATCTLIARYHGFVKGAIAQLAAIKALVPSEIDNYIIVEDGHYDKEIYNQLEKLGYKILAKPALRPIRSVDYVTHRWKYTFNKFYIWTLTDYDRVIYLDADCLPIVPNFHIPMLDLGNKQIAASRVKASTPNRFNAGVMSIQPSLTTYGQLLEILQTTAAGAELADQGLLNIFFQEYNMLPDRWNMRSWNNIVYEDIAIAHLRPTPWTRTTGSRGWMKYRAIWEQRYNEGLRLI